MITPISYNSLYTANHSWLQSRFHFSFAEYHDRENLHFDVLRVMNTGCYQHLSRCQKHK